MDLSRFITYAMEQFHIEEERKWEKDFPTFSVLCHPETGKWVALLMRQWDSDLGIEHQRCDLKYGDQSLVSNPAFPYVLPPFRMHGYHWIGIDFDQPITPDQELEVCQLLDHAIATGRKKDFRLTLDNNPASGNGSGLGNTSSLYRESPIRPLQTERSRPNSDSGYGIGRNRVRESGYGTGRDATDAFGLGSSKDAADASGYAAEKNGSRQYSHNPGDGIMSSADKADSETFEEELEKGLLVLNAYLAQKKQSPSTDAASTSQTRQLSSTDAAASRQARQPFYTMTFPPDQAGQSSYTESLIPQEMGVPEPIRKMRSLCTATDGSFQQKCKNFYLQGMYLKDYEDDQPWSGSFRHYFPTYQDLNTAQLRGYFTWRSHVRRGEYPQTCDSFVYMYLYELLNEIGTSSPQESLERMRELEIRYLGNPCVNDDHHSDDHQSPNQRKDHSMSGDHPSTEYHNDPSASDGHDHLNHHNAPSDSNGHDNPELRKNIHRWMLELAIVKQLPKEIVLEYADPDMLQKDASYLILKHPDDYSDDQVFDALALFAGNKMPSTSPVITKQGSRGKHLFAQAWRYTCSAYKEPGRDFFTACFGKRSLLYWRPLSNAVYWHRNRYDGIDFELSEARNYSCRHNIWHVERYEPLYYDKKKVAGFLHEADRQLRRYLGTGRELQERIEEVWAYPYIRAVIDADQKKQELLRKPQITIDLSGLEQIRKDAQFTRDSLLTENERGESIIAEASPNSHGDMSSHGDMNSHDGLSSSDDLISHDGLSSPDDLSSPDILSPHNGLSSHDVPPEPERVDSVTHTTTYVSEAILDDTGADPASPCANPCMDNADVSKAPDISEASDVSETSNITNASDSSATSDAADVPDSSTASATTTASGSSAASDAADLPDSSTASATTTASDSSATSDAADASCTLNKPQKNSRLAEWTSRLGEAHLSILLALLSNDTAVKPIMKEKHLIPSVVADSINEAFYDEIGDSVLECDGDHMMVVEDYREDLLQLLGISL